MRTLKKFIFSTAAFFLTTFTIIFVPAPSAAVEPVVPDKYNCTATTLPGGQDDSAFMLNLPYTLKLGDTEYQNVYITPNGVMTFGVPDGNFSSYPTTPSISLAGYDWVTFGEGTYLRYGTTADTLCIQWAVRPYPQSTGDITNITLLVDRYSNGTWAGQIISDGWLPQDLRRGIRFEPTQDVVLIDSTFQVGEGGVPIETQICWDGSVIPVTESCPPVIEPEILTREVQCSWTNPYTQEVVYGVAQQRYYLYWDGSTEDIDTVQSVCDALTPNFPEPEPVLKEREVQCVWTNPYTQETVNGIAIQRYYLYWNGTTVDVETAEVACTNATPVFEEPLPELKERIVNCTWFNPYQRVYVEGTAVAKYNLYWNGSEVYVVDPSTACEMATPLFEPNQYPEGSVYINVNEGGELDYTAPEGFRIKDILFASYGTPQNYQYGSCHAENSLTLVQNAVDNNVLSINADNGVFGDPCGGTYKNLAIVLTIEVDPNYEPPVPDPDFECWDGSIVYEESQCPPPPPTYECWDGSIVTDLSQCPNKPPTYECWDGSIVEDLSQCPPVPPTVECWDGTMVYDQSECPVQPPTVECWDGSMVYDQTECPVQPEPEPEPNPEPNPEPQPEPEPEPQPEPEQPTSEEELDNLSEELTSDGVLTDEEKEQLVDALIAEYNLEQAIPAGLIEELGLDYEDLPPDQPVTLENGVVLTAEVADAIEIFENTSELLSTVFTDPSKALTAIANVGADLPPVVREAAQKVALASVVVGQIVAGTTTLTLARRP